MNSPSDATLRRYYHKINHVAFNGKLNKKVKFYDWYRIKWDIPTRRRNIDGMSGRIDGVEIITINFGAHCNTCQWTITLIHEMVHQLFPQKVNCKSKRFQAECFRVMVKMGWGLL